MPKLSSDDHTLGSIRETVETLKQILTQIEGVAIAFDATKGLESVKIEKETSRKDGLAFLQQWADCARDAVREVRIERSKNGVSGNSGTYPVEPQKPPKSKRK